MRRGGSSGSPPSSRPCTPSASSPCWWAATVSVRHEMQPDQPAAQQYAVQRVGRFLALSLKQHNDRPQSGSEFSRIDVRS